MNRIKIGILCSLLFVTLVGCETATKWPEFSGFLGDYKGMYRSEEIEGIFIIKHEEKNVNDYSKFLIDPVTIQLTPEAKAYNMNKGDLAKVAKDFRDNIKSALQTQYTIVESPGSGVLQVRVAITDIFKKSDKGHSKGIVEAEFIDTQTKERIAAVLTSAEGMYFDEWAGLLRDQLEYLNSETKIYQFK